MSLLTKGFKQVSLDEFKEFLSKNKDDVTTRDLYDLNPPRVAYLLRNAQQFIRIAYIEDNEREFNGKPNKYFVNTSYA